MINKLRLYLYVLLFPIKSIELFKNDILAEKIFTAEGSKNNRVSNDKEIDEIRKLFLNEIEPFYKVYSYGELDLTIQRYYPYKLYNNTEKCYLNFMQTINNLTDSFITIRDGFVSYKYWENENDVKLFGIKGAKTKIQIFNYLIRFISMDLLIINKLVKNYRGNEVIYNNMPPLNGVYYNINIAEPLLDNILMKGVAENHMHLGSGYDFGISWGLMVNDIFFEKSKNNFITSDRIMDQINKNMLYYASALRLLLSIAAKGTTDFDKIDNCLCELKSLKTKLINAHTEHIDMRNELYEYCQARMKEFDIQLPEGGKDILFAVNSELYQMKTSGENILLFKVLCSIQKDEPCSKKIMGMFYDYLRVKNYIYSRIVEQDNIKGLTVFKRYFANSAASISYSTNEKWIELLRSKFQNPHLKKLEGRTSVADEYGKFKKSVYGILSDYKTVIDEDYNKGDIEFPMFGLVYSFKKKEDSSTNICWQMFGENNESSKARLNYKEIQDRYFMQMGYLIKIRNENPYISNFIIGIDTASQENDTPTSVFAPVYRSARDGNKDSLYLVDNNGLIVQQNSLNFTFHAGEDFRHIITGLRRIDEVIVHCKLHSGDRIGHGIALACDIDRWLHNNPIINIPRIELLENLLWVWGVYCDEAYSKSEVVLYLEREIDRYAGEIYGHTSGLTTVVLYKAYQKAFEGIIPNCHEYYKCTNDTVTIDQGACDNVLFCKMVDAKHALTWDEHKVALTKHCQYYLEKMREPICVEINEIEKQIIIDMQTVMSRKVAQMGIVIEVNPTSNAVIGEIDTVFNSHAFMLKSVNKTSENNVLLCVNTDNPAVFNTTVSNELSFMYYSLLEKGIDKDAALRWVDDVRATGLNASFLNNKTSHKQYYDYLCKALEYC